MRLPVARAVEVCPVEVAVSVVGGTWKLTLIKHLSAGKRRFNELGRLVPLANRKTLTRQLRELEEDGIVERTVHPEVPPRVEYALTELGHSLGPIVAAMDQWGAEFEARATRRR
ncbi:DNA-binding HxlR family transcriptional regulator [Microbacterium ginsengiterrae]|uniref:DNA-binding HxlR family transcriptional regulator n=1 Tax=Microbacterium ginsengiterrae TaxID=546115 RepID=A0A7W9FBY3_9MICO|nr:helix-turn-helix domain-containing protein [Microbacterium ginsengiterrae]MBB5743637.1 DNA-binding HxlR family transcriptional regulator [Microbacterium ginsengiterrae]